jgi:hypothetical protein
VVKASAQLLSVVDYIEQRARPPLGYLAGITSESRKSSVIVWQQFMVTKENSLCLALLRLALCNLSSSTHYWPSTHYLIQRQWHCARHDTW